MTSAHHAFCAALFCLLLVPAAASAQSPGDTESATSEAVGQEMTSAPVGGQTAASISLGATSQSGRTNTKGLTINGIVSHTTAAQFLMRLDGAVSVSDFRPAPGQPFVEVENKQLASLLIMHPLRRHMSLLTQAGFLRDVIIQLDHRAWVEGGIGFHLSETKKLNLMIAPLFAVGTEHRAYTDEGNKVADAGVLQTLMLRASSTLTVEEYLVTHYDTTDAADSYTTFNASLLPQIAPHTSLKLYYEYERSALTPPGVDRVQRQAGVAVQFSFAKQSAAQRKP